MEISFIQPSRNNLKYLKWSYGSIRKNQGDHTVEICVADDFSNDGTEAWCKEVAKKDPNFKFIRNDGPERVGHTILYDRLVNEVATKDIAIIFHADMYLAPGALNAIEKYIKPKTIVSLTRIEPPLHPDGPEKVLRNFGTEPEDFPEEYFSEWFRVYSTTVQDKITEGIFAPWAFYRQDFQEIGGHDPLFAPQSKEDSDIFNRFLLNGVNFIQTWEGCVYHMTCRGSRYNPTITTVGKESDEWLRQNEISTRNFIRKWGHFVKHDKFMKPLVDPRYNIEIRLFNSSLELLTILEPWCDQIIVDSPIKQEYIEKEQSYTNYTLNERVFLDNETSNQECDVVVRVDGNKITSETLNIFHQLPAILSSNEETGVFNIGSLEVTINRIRTYTKSLIHLN